MRSDTRPEEPTRKRSGEPTRPSGDEWIGVSLRSVVSGARRRATRDADRQMDTAHLLHSLLESDPRCRDAVARAAAGVPGTGGDYQVARVLGYLAQRSIGYGMDWRHSVEGSGARPAVTSANAPGWSPAALAALSEAGLCAAADGRPSAEGTDLLGALAADPGCRAADVLRAVGVDPRRLATASTVGRIARSYRDDGPVAS